MDNEYYIRKCLDLANQAKTKNEIPIGALVTQDGIVISKSHNLSITNHDPTAHAEVNVIRDACKKTNNYRLSNAVLYTTLEPCIICIGAICEARIDCVVFGAYSNNDLSLNKDFNFIKKKFNLDHTPEFIGGVLEDECSLIVKDFFKAKRC
tara:strand:- start:12 stop:464 length:453 start_codon:yes stop_codon:yes gene_type:complete